MFEAVRLWWERRRGIRRRWQADARRLVQLDEPAAYYCAQRLAARARATGEKGEFLHWAKVAAEVARISKHAEMDFSVVTTIVDEEMRRAPSHRREG